MTLSSHFKIISVFFTFILIISTTSTAWNKNRIGIPSMFTAENDNTALIWAAHNGDLKMVKVLLEWGADPSLQDHKGHTAAWWANRSGHPDIVTLLEGS